ncbi:MAG: type 4a pilus biogenesis protein PilO [Actinobacteria bacterium]|nr:type 4a pilus biogenesis protein PilO [Actinomycetota bacterium]
MKRRDRYIVGGLVAVVVVAVYWFFLLSPLRTKVADTQAQVDAAQTQLVTLQSKLAQMSQSQDQAKRNQARLLELSKMLPDQDEIPSLLLQIQDLATESGIDFMTMTPSKSAAGATAAAYGTVSMSLQFTGTFFDVNDFLYRTEQLAAAPGRLLSVQSLTLTPGGAAAVGVSPPLTVGMTILAYKRTSAAAPAAGSTGTSPSKAG